MNRTLLIIVGVVILLILVGLWVYLLFFGTPQDPKAVFGNFGFGPDDDPSIMIDDGMDDGERPQVDVKQPGLRQLTTRPVAGFEDVQQSTTSPHFMYYGEAGTGHIYRIDLTTGTEERLSSVTIPSAHNIDIGPDGDYVVARTGFTNANDVVFRSLISTGTSSDALSVLPGTILSYRLYTDGQLMYVAPDADGSVLKVLDLGTLRERTVATLPLTQIVVAWGETVDATHYIYPKPTYYLPSALYEIRNGVLYRTEVSGSGLTAEASSDTIAYSYSERGREYISAVRSNGSANTPSLMTVLPEKCDFSSSGGTLYCATSNEANYRNYPDIWYQGSAYVTDSLFKYTIDKPATTYLSDLKAESGREIDVTDLSVGKNDLMLFFVNKRDNSLWAYDI